MYIYIYIYVDTHTYIYVHTHAHIYKEFTWEDQRRRRCYIFHIAPRGVNCAILSVQRTG